MVITQEEIDNYCRKYGVEVKDENLLIKKLETDKIISTLNIFVNIFAIILAVVIMIQASTTL